LTRFKPVGQDEPETVNSRRLPGVLGHLVAKRRPPVMRGGKSQLLLIPLPGYR